ncbi:hypothetical protein BSM4216_3448 [Bacillus smithii]|nr:hypothetical protein BSM4216_3448 [Bacillus smithii]
MIALVYFYFAAFISLKKPFTFMKDIFRKNFLKEVIDLNSIEHINS